MRKATFDRTYEGLKLVQHHAVGGVQVAFDRTYEGLKQRAGFEIKYTPLSFDRTYEGLKRELRFGDASIGVLLTAPMRV